METLIYILVVELSRLELSHLYSCSSDKREARVFGALPMGEASGNGDNITSLTCMNNGCAPFTTFAVQTTSRCC